MENELSNETRRQLQALGDALARSNLTFELSMSEKELNEGVKIIIRVDKHLLKTVKNEIWKGIGKRHSLSFFPIH